MRLLLTLAFVLTGCNQAELAELQAENARLRAELEETHRSIPMVLPEPVPLAEPEPELRSLAVSVTADQLFLDGEEVSEQTLGERVAEIGDAGRAVIDCRRRFGPPRQGGSGHRYSAEQRPAPFCDQRPADRT